MPRLFIHAPNVHHGGGAVLLTELLRAAPHDGSTFAVLDERMTIPPEFPAPQVTRVPPTVVHRLAAENRLAAAVRAEDRVLCFGNLPPLFRLRGRAFVFLQNRYLVDRLSASAALPPKVRLRLLLERIWLRTRRANAARYFVQTPSMQNLARQALDIPVECFAFVPEALRHLGEPAVHATALCYDFVYVASGEAHKNHGTLLEAWKLLASEGLFPSLALTLSPNSASALVRQIELEAAAKALRIENLGVLPHEHVLALYGQAAALVYPSKFESFGLPLLEARRAGLPVLAPELDYVRDVVDPVETFDPQSAVSLARAVKRFLSGRPPRADFRGASELLAYLGGRGAA